VTQEGDSRYRVPPDRSGGWFLLLAAWLHRSLDLSLYAQVLTGHTFFGVGTLRKWGLSLFVSGMHSHAGTWERAKDTAFESLPGFIHCVRCPEPGIHWGEGCIHFIHRLWWEFL